jgi:Wiskott-Aldrich syndrome protein
MARSIERLSTAVAELTAANTRLVQDVRVKDGQLAAREEMLRKKEDRVKALSLENERLSNEVGRLGLEVERLRGGGGTGNGGGAGGGAGT